MPHVMHQDMEALVEARSGLPEAQTIADERANWGAYAARLSEPPPGDMHVEDILIETPDRAVPVRRYEPAGILKPAPAIVYFHGGGFMKGDLDSSDANAWGFAELARAIVFSVDYRLTPEHPYPAAFNDSYGVTSQLVTCATTYNIDAERVALTGDSAGGNLAAAVCLAARDRSGPSICAQALIYPGTGLDQDAGSYVENADAFGLTTAATVRYRDLYLPHDPQTLDAYARPVVAQDHGNLPPAWIHSAEIDPIRDDGRVYASKLALAGSDVHYREARQMIHGFMRARFHGAAARREFELICRFLHNHLHA